MSTQALGRDDLDKEGNVMQTRRIPGMRLLAYATALALALSLMGDRGLAVGVPASVYGQDPLEVLELKVRPNVFVVLDSSGSMQEMLQYPAQPPVTGNTTHNMRSGDHQRSKMRLAKETLRRVITNNESKVSFLFGQYTQNNSRGLNNNNASHAGAGAHRFQYTANNDPAMGGFASMTTTELTVQGANLDTLGRGLQSWQDIRAGWNRLYFEEDASPDALCIATLPVPTFYREGALLATALQTAMNSAACSGSARANTYSVSYATATGRFSFARTAGARPFRIRWDNAPSNIRNALAETSTAVTTFGTGTVTTDAPWTLLYRNTSTANSGTGIGSGNAAGQPVAPYKFLEPIDPDGPGPLATRVVTYYNMRAGRMFNGETIKVLANGAICDMVYPTPPLPTPLPEFYVQQVASCGGADVGGPVTFGWSGSQFSGNNISCNGFSAKVPLVPCDLQSPPAPTQITTINPYIDYEFTFNPDGTPQNYAEAQDGGWAATTVPLNTVPAKADGATPIAASLTGIRTLFGTLWNTGQAGATTMAGPPPYQITPIRTHRNPKEKTIVLFVTDGDDTCAPGSDNDEQALAAAYQAELLYRRINAAEPASSVQTYVIGFGNGAAPYRLNWIAWGGSGLGNPAIGNNGTRWTPSWSGSFAQNCAAGSKCASINSNLTPLRANCKTCTDAFIAPDPVTLAEQLQSIIDQGASDGEFSAQQSITESVYEYLDPSVLIGTPPKPFDALDPKTRFGAIYPTRFITSFTLPGFNGQLKAYQNDGAGNSVLLWSAGDKLRHLVSSAMVTCGGSGGASAGECTFGQIAGAGAQGIKRRVYSTDRNGVYPFSPDTLIDASTGAAPANRVQLWPPQATVAPNSYSTEGILDVELGLPPDSASNPAAEFTALQTKFRACLGTNLPAACSSASALTRMQAARREARDMILAFMAGGAPVSATGITGVKRSSGAIGSSPAQSLLFVARSWVLGDSEMATAAVVTPPQTQAPQNNPYEAEYDMYVKGPRDAGSRNPGTASQIKEGVGLALPDDDADPATPASLEPVMTVVYLPANDMLHAFRAGPNVPASQCQKDTTPADAFFPNDVVQMNAARDCGGEELWGFVPYDQLASVTLRFVNEPQGRANHVYMLARGIRFGDVFVPGTVTRNLGGVAPPAGSKGVWRRVMYFGRGIGGKYVTALDVTGPGTHLERASNTIGPIPLWNRGNPDTQDGLPGGPHNNSLNDPGDFNAYAKMGETWSVPTLAYVNSQKNNPLYRTPRIAPDTVDFALFMGSGYGAPGEGTTHYTLDALTGDVVAAVDVGSRAFFNDYPNALVANSVSFNRVIEGVLGNEHPWSFESTRVYFADLHGRLWKMLTNEPTVAYPAADLGTGQAVATAVALTPSDVDPAADVGPYIFVTSGADRRAAGPFRIFTFLDTGNDVNAAVGAPVGPGADGVTYYPPVEKQFSRLFDPGNPEANCGYTAEGLFRGTVQPTGSFECVGSIVNGKCSGSLTWRVFFAGTRLSLPNTKFAPPTPLACGTGEYPCRSQFDSIIYALGAKSGAAAYDLNASGDDAYRVFRDSRIAAISMQADPDPGRGGSSFTPDEGLIKGIPKPPPPPGVPPTASTATANVVMAREPGKPAPSVRYGSTVCQ